MTNKVQAVQGLRRSNAAQAIPARKPARRGGRAEQRRRAIADQNRRTRSRP